MTMTTIKADTIVRVTDNGEEEWRGSWADFCDANQLDAAAAEIEAEELARGTLVYVGGVKVEVVR
jgi:hypothetical protein